MLKVQNLIKIRKYCKALRLVPRCQYSTDIPQLLKDGTWNAAPICQGRKMEDDADICCPKSAGGACPKLNDDPCTMEGLQTELMCCSDPRLTQECEKSAAKRSQKKKKPEPPFKSMWETLPGYERDCRAPERLDNTRYKISDKSKRIYYRTWEECDRVKIRKKKVCCFDELPQSTQQQQKRTSSDKPITACEQKEPELLKVDLTALKECMGETTAQKKEGKCRKIRMPHCQPARKVPKCLKVRKIDCKRECAPYPSFSECVRDALRKGRPVECDCTAVPMQCIVFEFLKRKEKYHLPPPVPGWPPQRPK